MFQSWSDCVSGGTTLSIIGKSLRSEDLKVPFVNYWILQHPPPFPKVHPSPAHPSVQFPLRKRYPSCLRPRFKGLKKQIHLGRAYYSRRFSRSRFYCKTNNQGQFLFAPWAPLIQLWIPFWNSNYNFLWPFLKTFVLNHTLKKVEKICYYIFIL